MRVETLPSPGLLSNGIRIRIEAAKAISAVEINAGIPANQGKSSTAKQLDTFFAACRTALTDLIDTTSPTLTSAVIALATPTKMTLTFSDDLDTSSVPAAGAFTTTGQIKTASAIAVYGRTVELTFGDAFTSDAVNIVYTDGATNLTDTDGNIVASIVATAVTNNVV